ncbi:MAG: leucine-rich repeat domain-containing protein [Methanobrevibacter sp.]|nr:leucine-rich repeat domain-containing protein [Methanobrevibacter sp.]
MGKNVCDTCLNLKEVRLPNNLETIPRCAFENCISLERINIPSSIRKIEKHAFRNCPKLKDISIPSYVIVDDQAFINSNISTENDIALKSIDNLILG